MTDLKIDYESNPVFLRPPLNLSNVSVIVPVDGGVEIMHSKPSAAWYVGCRTSLRNMYIFRVFFLHLQWGNQLLLLRMVSSL